MNLEISTASSSAGTWHAILVGVGSYADSSIAATPAACNDVRAVRDWLLGSERVAAADMLVLQEEAAPAPLADGPAPATLQPTHASFKQALTQWLVDRFVPGDSVVLYFSGQGGCHGADGYLILSDTRRDALAETAVAATWLGSFLLGLPALHVLVCLDTSFRGRREAWSSTSVGGLVYVGPRGLSVIASTLPYVVAQEVPADGSYGGAGALTRALLRVLAKGEQSVDRAKNLLEKYLGREAADGLHVWQTQRGEPMPCQSGPANPVPFVTGTERAPIAECRVYLEGQVRPWSTTATRRWRADVVADIAAPLAGVTWTAVAIPFYSSSSVVTVHLLHVKSGAGRRVHLASPGSLRSSALSPDGRYLVLAAAMGAEGYSVLACDVWEGRLIEYEAGREDVTCLAVSPQSPQVALGRQRGEVDLWDLTSGEVRRITVPEAQGDDVQSLAFSPSARILAVGTASGKIHLWELISSSVAMTLHKPPLSPLALAFSPDGTVLAAAGFLRDDEEEWRVEEDDEADRGQVAFFEVESGEGRCCGADDWDEKTEMRRVAFSPDGRHVATLDPEAESSVYLWDWRKGKLKGTILADAPSLGKAAVAEGFGGFAFAPGGHFILAWTPSGHVRIFTLASCQYVGTAAFVGPGTDWIVATGDGRFDATGTLEASIRWRLGTQEVDLGGQQPMLHSPGLLESLLRGRRPKPAPRVPLPKTRRQAAPVGVRHQVTPRLVYTHTPFPPPDATSTGQHSAKPVATGWLARIGGFLGRVTGQESSVPGPVEWPHPHCYTGRGLLREVAVASDVFVAGHFAWSGFGEKLQCVIQRSQEQVTARHASPDGRKLAWGTETGCICVSDLRSGATISRWEAHAGSEVAILEWTSRRMLLSADTAGTICLWSESGSELHRIKVGTGRAWASMSPDGHTLAAIAPYGPLVLVDVDSGVQEVLMEKVFSDWPHLVFTSPSRLVVECSLNTLLCWDLPGREPSAFLGGHGHNPGELAGSPEGRWLAARWDVVYSSGIALWDLSRRAGSRELGMRRGGRNNSRSRRTMAFSPVGPVLIASDDRPVVFYHLEKAHVLGELLASDDGQDWAVVSYDGRYDGSRAALDLVTWSTLGEEGSHEPASLQARDKRRLARREPGLMARLLRGG